MLDSAVENHRQNVTNRERCEGERQCGEGSDRRSATRAGIARESGLGGSLEQRGPQVNGSLTLRFHLFLEKIILPDREQDARKMIR